MYTKHYAKKNIDFNLMVKLLDFEMYESILSCNNSCGHQWHLVKFGPGKLNPHNKKS